MSVPVTAPTAAVIRLQKRISEINTILEPLLVAPLGETLGKLSVLERCQLEVMLSYAINTLFFIYLKTQGINPKDHAVFRELNRVKQYIDKIKTTQGLNNRTMSVDKEAAARFIKHNLIGNVNQNEDSDIEEGRQANSESPGNLEAQELADTKKRAAPLNEDGKTKRRRMDPFSGYDDDANAGIEGQ